MRVCETNTSQLGIGPDWDLDWMNCDLWLRSTVKSQYTKVPSARISFECPGVKRDDPQTDLSQKLIGPHLTLQAYLSSHISWLRGPNTQSLEVTLPEGNSVTGALKTLKMNLRKSGKLAKANRGRMTIPSPRVGWQGREVKRQVHSPKGVKPPLPSSCGLLSLWFGPSYCCKFFKLRSMSSK